MRDLTLLRQVRDRIDREYAQPLDVEALARGGVNMSAGHLSRKFRQTYGESPYSYLMTRRIERAMTLLRRGDLSVTEVCFEVGCSSLGTFSTRFTELVGGSADGVPRTVRRRHRRHPPRVSGQEHHETDQESRSAAGVRMPSLTSMNITIQYTFLPHTDGEAALAFYRDLLGFEVRKDVGYEGMRWLTVGPPNQPGTSIVLHPPAADPGITDAERQTILELIAKGSYGALTLATEDLDGLFEKLQANGVDIIQEPMDQPYGVRDAAVRDPAGNLIRIDQAV